LKFCQNELVVYLTMVSPTQIVWRRKIGYSCVPNHEVYERKHSWPNLAENSGIFLKQQIKTKKVFGQIDWAPGNAHLRNVTDCRVCVWPWQWLALGRADLPLFVTINKPPTLCRSTVFSWVRVSTSGLWEPTTFCLSRWNCNGVFSDKYTFIEILPAGVVLLIFINDSLAGACKWEFSDNLYDKYYRVLQRITGLVRFFFMYWHTCFIYTHSLLRHIWHCSNSSLMKTYTQTNVKE
jgi:hypothetical protein